MAELPHSITNLIFLFLLQIGIGCGFVAFYTLGLTYLDDNAVEHNSAALIGTIFTSLVRRTTENGSSLQAALSPGGSSASRLATLC